MYSFNNDLLRKARKDKGYTQESFAKMIGIARTTYAEYEQGKIQPPIDKIQRICRILHKSQDDFVKVKNDTGIDVSEVRLKTKMSESQKVILIKRLQDKLNSIEDMRTIQEVVHTSRIDASDKSVIISLLGYISSKYDLSPAEYDLKDRLEKNTKEIGID